MYCDSRKRRPGQISFLNLLMLRRWKKYASKIDVMWLSIYNNSSKSVLAVGYNVRRDHVTLHKYDWLVQCNETVGYNVHCDLRNFTQMRVASPIDVYCAQPYSGLSASKLYITECPQFTCVPFSYITVFLCIQNKQYGVQRKSLTKFKGDFPSRCIILYSYLRQDT